MKQFTEEENAFLAESEMGQQMLYIQSIKEHIAYWEQTLADAIEEAEYMLKEEYNKGVWY